MKKNHTDISKLKSYSALAATLVTVSAGAQVSITDLDPDVVLEAGDFFELDINGDSETDLTFLNALVSASLYNSQNLFVSQGSVAGTVATVDGYYFALASVIDVGETLAESDNWVPYLGICYFNLLGGDGPWLNAIDKFSGFRLKDGSDYNYGWIRMDITQEPFVITIKDVAYNTTIDEAVTTEFYVNIQSEESSPAQVFMAESMLHIQLEEGVTDARVILYNMNGEKLFVDLIHSSQSIDVSRFPKGVYIISIIVGENVFTTKQVLK